MLIFVALFGNGSQSTPMVLTPIPSGSIESSTENRIIDVNDNTARVKMDDIDSIVGIIFGLLAMLIIVTFCSVMLRNLRNGSNRRLLLDR